MWSAFACGVAKAASQPRSYLFFNSPMLQLGPVMRNRLPDRDTSRVQMRKLVPARTPFFRIYITCFRIYATSCFSSVPNHETSRT